MSKLEQTANNLKINRYDHGGCRIYLEDMEGKRELICDTYGNELLREEIYGKIIDLLEEGFIIKDDEINE